MIKFERTWAMPSAWTFTIKPVQTLLVKYEAMGLAKKGRWVDPFAGKHSPADVTNDINPEMPTDYHLDAFRFCLKVKGAFDGVLFDPPYSYRQVSEHYKAVGIKPTQLDTSNNFYNRVMNAICDKIKNGGLAISFGWNSNGFGKNRGFEVIDGLLVAHGGHHNDTIVTVERKLKDYNRNTKGSEKYEI